MKPSLRVRYFGLGLFLSERRDGRWEFEATDLGRLREAIGEELLAALLSCFVWTDRLASAWHFHYLNIQHLDEASVAFGRNMQALVWYAGGVLHEAAKAVRELDAAGVGGRLADQSHWQELRDMAERWLTDERLIRVRNNVGFHVSTKLIRRGIATASREGERLVILAGDDRTAGRTSRRLGLELLLKGSHRSLADIEALIEIMVNDSGKFTDLVEHVLNGLLKSAGAMA